MKEPVKFVLKLPQENVNIKHGESAQNQRLFGQVSRWFLGMLAHQFEQWIEQEDTDIWQKH